MLPALALLALVAWIFASPIGAAADDDYHLVSTWCANPVLADDWCAPGSSPKYREVPEELVDVACYAQAPESSAACQDDLWADGAQPVDTNRGNFVGAYPPVYYAVMSVFAGGDIQLSALIMRFFTVLLFLGITIALYLLLPLTRRPALLWMWLITTVPLGIFLLASNNPSSWALIGVGSALMALLGYFESEGRRRIALGALFAISVVMAAGSRGDAALYVGFAIALVLLLKFARTRGFLVRAVLPLVMGLVAFAFFLSARQVASGLGGFGGGGSALPGPGAGTGAEEQLTGFALFAYNALNVPFIWSGVFGTWGLGWLDTSMPWLVPLGAIAVFVAVGITGLGRKDWRTAIAIGLTGAALWAIPVYTLQAGGGMVGEQVQPRYLFPLIVLLGGLLMLTPAAKRLSLGRVPAYTIAATLAVINFVALHMNIRRYVTGIDGAGPNLDAGAEWWWQLPVGPGVVWILGSLAYGALVVLLVPRLAAGRPVVTVSSPEPSPVR